MKNKIFFIISLLSSMIFLSACNSNALHIRNSESLPPEKLSEFAFQGNEVYPIFIDDIRFEGKVDETYYIESGRHKITMLLNWSDVLPVGNIYVTSNTSSDKVRTVCLDFKPGDRYTIRASDSSKDWKGMATVYPASGSPLWYDVILESCE